MKSVTATGLRQNLFRNLEEILEGHPMLVHTKRGNVVIVPERLWKQRKEGEMADPRKPKISGEILLDLDSADRALRSHLKWPRQ